MLWVRADAAELAGRVGRVLEAALLAGLGVDLDDGPAALRLHHRCGVFGAEEVADQVDVDDRLPASPVKLLDRAGKEHGGVGHQNVEPAKAFQRGRNHSRHLFFIGDIDMHSQRLAIGLRRDGLRHLLGALEVEVGHHHMRAFLGQTQADGLAQPLRATGHNRNFIEQRT